MYAHYKICVNIYIYSNGRYYCTDIIVNMEENRGRVVENTWLPYGNNVGTSPYIRYIYIIYINEIRKHRRQI